MNTLSVSTAQLLAYIGMNVRWMGLPTYEEAVDWLYKEKKLYVTLYAPSGVEFSCWTGVFTDFSRMRGPDTDRRYVENDFGCFADYDVAKEKLIEEGARYVLAGIRQAKVLAQNTLTKLNEADMDFTYFKVYTHESKLYTGKIVKVGSFDAEGLPLGWEIEYDDRVSLIYGGEHIETLCITGMYLHTLKDKYEKENVKAS